MELKDRVQVHLTTISSLCPSGFAAGLHLGFTTPAVLLRTYDRRWIDIYSRESLILADPVVAWGVENTRPVRWSDLPGGDPRRILARAARYGLAFGVATAVEEGGSRSLAGFARPDREFTDDEMARLHAELTALHRMTAPDAPASAEMRRLLSRGRPPGADPR